MEDCDLVLLGRERFYLPFLDLVGFSLCLFCSHSTRVHRYGLILLCHASVWIAVANIFRVLPIHTFIRKKMASFLFSIYNRQPEMPPVP